jgi:putative acetyltransferase
MVRDEMLPADGFWVAADEEDKAVGFLHLDGEKVEALFVDPAWHRKWLGRALMDHAARLSPKPELDAIEHSSAAEFYRSLSFEEVPVTSRWRRPPLSSRSLKKNQSASV